MIIRIDQKAEEPLYLQIRSQIIAAIARGELVPGAALPSVRSLASDLGINLHTVNKAYAVLRDEGYVLMRGRSGAYIADPCEDDRADRAQIELAKMEDSLFELALAHRARGGTRGETVRCDIQTLTAMFYGYKRPTYLKRVERLQANDTAVRILEDIIPIEQPYFSDYF